LTSELH